MSSGNRQRFFNSRTNSGNTKKHCYLLPYFEDEEGIEVFFIRKKSISSKDGFIHNNPGQYAISGGENKSGESYTDAALREFKEELNIDLVITEENTHSFSGRKYFFLFFKISNTIPEFLEQIEETVNKGDEKFLEVNDFAFFELSRGREIMYPSLYDNSPDVSLDNLDYFIENLQKNENWTFKSEGKSLDKYLNNNFNNKYLNEDVLYSIRKDGLDSPYYTLFISFLTYHFYTRSDTDWFFKALNNIVKK